MNKDNVSAGKNNPGGIKQKNIKRKRLPVRKPLSGAPGGATNYLIEVFNNQMNLSLLENNTETMLKQFWQLVALVGVL